MTDALSERDTAIISALRAFDGPGGTPAPVEIANPEAAWSERVRGFKTSNAALEEVFKAIAERFERAPMGQPEWLVKLTIETLSVQKETGVIRDATAIASSGPDQAVQRKETMKQMSEAHQARLEAARLIMKFAVKSAIDDIAFAVASDDSLKGTPFAGEVREAGGIAENSELARPMRVDRGLR